MRRNEIELDAGASNTVLIWTEEQWADVSLDEIVVSAPEDLAAAVHRLPEGLPDAYRTWLLAFLRQLDGRALGP